MRDFTIGRDDFSLTVYVPWNCSNNCSFCSSKNDYARIKPNFDCVKKSLMRIRESIVPTVVFTGGEPTFDLDGLSELVSIVDNKTVYINTTLPKKNCNRFIDFINTTECIKGVSISRHCFSYEEDLALLNEICEDNIIANITKPVRINVVSLKDNHFSSENIKLLVERWMGVRLLKSDCYDSLILNLRSNYVTQKKNNLHDLENNIIINDLATEYFYYKHSFCNVCDTCVFFKENRGRRVFEIDYHRGLLKTSLDFGNVTEVNDLILLQDGSLCYDWDGRDDNIDDLLSLLNI